MFTLKPLKRYSSRNWTCGRVLGKTQDVSSLNSLNTSISMHTSKHASILPTTSQMYAYHRTFTTASLDNAHTMDASINLGQENQKYGLDHRLDTIRSSMDKSSVIRMHSQQQSIFTSNSTLGNSLLFMNQRRLYSNESKGLKNDSSKANNSKENVSMEKPTKEEGSKGNTNNDTGNNPNNGLYIAAGGVALLVTVGGIIIYKNYFENAIKFVPDELNEGSRRAIEVEKELESASPDEIMERILHQMEAEEEVPTGIINYLKYIWRSFKLSLKLFPLFLFFPVLWLNQSLHKYWYRLFVRTLRSCGACFIKLGQWMATRPDLFPKELCVHLGELHSSGDRHKFVETKRILTESFGRPIEDIFEEFDHKEIASGAIAQIYKGKLKQSVIDELGIELESPYVAVKVRHPRVKKDLVTDLRIIRVITKFMGKFDYFKHLNLEENVVVFSRNMLAQLDMKTEAENLRIFRNNFREIPQITFPVPVEQLTTSRVLVESFEEGIPISEFTSISDQSTQYFKNQLASLGIILFLKMLVVDNFLHADLHPGNLFVRFNVENNYYSPNLVVLDAGLVCGLSPTDKKNFLDLFKAITKKQGREVAEMMIYRSKTYRNRDPNSFTPAERENLNAFIDKMDVLVRDVIDLPFGEVQIGSTMSKVLDLGREYHVPVEANFTTLVIGSIVIEGLGRQLNPTLRFVEEAKPVLSQVTELREEWIKNRFENLVTVNKFKLDEIFKDVDSLFKGFNVLNQKCE